MEERGHDTSQYTEEELYSSVIRPDDKLPKYVPPGLRSQQTKQISPKEVKKPGLQISTTLDQINSKLEQATHLQRWLDYIKQTSCVQ
jgi:PAB1-binding protein PBP1